jgi:hypothetical protein
MDSRTDGIVKLKPDSLVGSCFHSFDDGMVCWQGTIVAEPHAGIYLVELCEWLIGAATHQQLVRIEDMVDWHFYDDPEWMNSRYRTKWEAVADQRERETVA